jgi:multidrug efflux pump subunit AcrA (membrane-fusion protein)
MRAVKRLLTKPVIAIGLLALAAAVIGWSWYARSGRQLLFSTVMVRHGDLVATISATGTIEPVEVRLGALDGANTAVSSATLHDGQEAVTGEVVETAQNATQNPFIPQFRKR